jgi:hypothetical protein
MAYWPVDGYPDPKARGPQETPDKPKPTEIGGAAGRIECGMEASLLGARHSSNGIALFSHYFKRYRTVTNPVDLGTPGRHIVIFPSF